MSAVFQPYEKTFQHIVSANLQPSMLAKLSVLRLQGPGRSMKRRMGIPLSLLKPISKWLSWKNFGSRIYQLGVWLSALEQQKANYHNSLMNMVKIHFMWVLCPLIRQVVVSWYAPIPARTMLLKAAKDAGRLQNFSLGFSIFFQERGAIQRNACYTIQIT